MGGRRGSGQVPDGPEERTIPKQPTEVPWKAGRWGGNWKIVVEKPEVLPRWESFIVMRGRGRDTFAIAPKKAATETH